VEETFDDIEPGLEVRAVEFVEFGGCDQTAALVLEFELADCRVGVQLEFVVAHLLHDLGVLRVELIARDLHDGQLLDARGLGVLLHGELAVRFGLERLHDFDCGLQPEVLHGRESVVVVDQLLQFLLLHSVQLVEFVDEQGTQVVEVLLLVGDVLPTLVGQVHHFTLLLYRNLAEPFVGLNYLV